MLCGENSPAGVAGLSAELQHRAARRGVYAPVTGAPSGVHGGMSCLVPCPLLLSYGLRSRTDSSLEGDGAGECYLLGTYYALASNACKAYEEDAEFQTSRPRLGGKAASSAGPASQGAATRLESHALAPGGAGWGCER